jgi:macrodomain Ter protein organizer (MatP/YcbG family)
MIAYAQKEIEDAGITAFSTPEKTTEFREKYLSKSGKTKLSSSLRTYKKRNSQKLTRRQLDLNISLPAHIALETLASELELTKTQLIEQLILDRREKQSEEV